jgi:hypothetical protein
MRRGLGRDDAAIGRSSKSFRICFISSNQLCVGIVRDAGKGREGMRDLRDLDGAR